MTLGLYRNAAGSQGGSTTPQAAITVPRTGGSAVQDTDYCILIVVAGDGTNPSAAPDGTWSTIKANSSFNSGGSRYAVFGKIIGSATTITPSWPTAPASGNNTAHLALFYSGVAGAEAVGTAGTPSVASTATSAPSTTTLGPDRVALAVAIMKGGSGGFASSVSWSGGFTPRASQLANGNFYPSIAVAAGDIAAAGATAEQTATWNFSTLNQIGVQLALVPSVVALSATASVAPTSGSGPLDVTLTVTATGGNGNPKTYSVDWGDGSSSPSQSSNVFTHTYAAVGAETVRNWIAFVSQA